LPKSAATSYAGDLLETKDLALLAALSALALDVVLAACALPTAGWQAWDREGRETRRRRAEAAA
jgi:hypothetical protein